MWMTASEQFSHDQAVKNLIKSYPIEALEFLAEDVVQAYGTPVEVEFLDTSVVKDDVAEPGPGQAMDLAIRFGFADGRHMVFVLVEHWSNADKLDLLRTARYYLDLCRRYIGEEVLAIALVDDDRPRELADTVERGALGLRHFLFHTRIIQIPALSLEKYRDTANRVALSFSPNMAGADAVEQVLRVTVVFQELGDTMGVCKFFAFWIVEGRLMLEEQREVKQRLKEMDMPEIMEWFKQEGIEEGIERGIEQGIQQGMRASKLEDARKMLERGCDWEFITSINGIKPEDLAT